MTPADLTACRQRLDLTRAELAAHLGVARMTIHHWETGNRPIPAYLHLALQSIEEKSEK